ncbi:MAG: glycosyltransferase family 2 protein [Thermodesulfobacteriota bacterium]
MYSKKPILDIIYVNRNSGDSLINSILSIERTRKNFFLLGTVIVVDDNSTDHSLTGINNIKLPTVIISNHEHTGYGKSCNLGAKNSQADYLLFLNTDTILSESALDEAIDFMQKPLNKDVAIVGIKLMDKDGNVAKSCSRFPTLVGLTIKSMGLDRLFPGHFRGHFLHEFDHLSNKEVDQVIGAFMMIRRKIFNLLNGYDERFFVYMEDLDLSLRLKMLGFKSVYLSTTSSYHEGGRTSKEYKAESLFFNLRSKIQYSFKHMPFWQASLVLLLILFIEPITRTCYFYFNNKEELVVTKNAYKRLWKWAITSKITYAHK